MTLTKYVNDNKDRLSIKYHGVTYDKLDTFKKGLIYDMLMGCYNIVRKK